MKRLVYISLLCLIFTACSEEEVPNLSGIPASLTLSINTMQNDVITRAVSPDLAEKRMFNFYVFVFNKDGSIDYQKLHTLVNSTTEPTSLSIQKLSCGSEKSVVVVANIAPTNTIVNITEDMLNNITSREQLNELIIEMPNTSIERATSFLSSGTAEGVTVSAKGATTVKISLERVDAKIRFNVSTAEGVTFTPTDWRIRSMPKKIRVMDKHTELLCSTANDCFDSQWAKFEEGGPTFAFYSMEHLPTPKDSIPDGTPEERYAAREKQDKSHIENGSIKNGDFIYAPATGTYVEIRGIVTYKKEDGHTISADVVYTVHFGGIVGDDVNVNDYQTHRNTFYTYNVTIVSVNAILVEVESGSRETVEPRPGAEGDVTETEYLLNLDAHNEIFMLEINRSMVKNTLTWNVNTPFSKGSEKENPTDYKWIYFQIHNKTGNPQLYTNDFRTYPGEGKIYQGDMTLGAYKDQLLDVKQLVALLKESIKPENNDISLFDANGMVKFTAFVNEYYYETDPNNPNSTAVNGLWKEFTNQQQRVMNILSELNYSYDHESSKSNAVYSIRQHAIQTMYNRSLKENFTAWGLQMIQNEVPVVFDSNNNSYVAAAKNLDNGRMNTIELWKKINSWNTYIAPASWTMNKNYRTAKYNCLRMNRDNDGDGTIQEKEVQWYLAAINQLTDIWIGEWSYDPSARLYKETAWTERHFVSSTVLNSHENKDNPQILWSSEGSSTGLLTRVEKIHAGSVNQPVYYRCVRNLGMPRDADINRIPTNLVEYDSKNHHISLKRLDEQSIRATYQTTQELPVHNERENSNKPYWEFEVSQEVQGGDSYTWQTLFNHIQAGGRLCLPGYRIPNQRELALMSSRIKNDGKWTLANHFSRTSFKLGLGTRPGFSVAQDATVLFLVHGEEEDEKGGVRCVKDWVEGISK